MALGTRSVLQVKRVKAKDWGQQPISGGSDLEQSPLPSLLTCITLVCTQEQKETHSLSTVTLRSLHLQPELQTGPALSLSVSISLHPRPLDLANFYPPLDSNCSVITYTSKISLSTPCLDRQPLVTVHIRQWGSKWCYCSSTIPDSLCLHAKIVDKSKLIHFDCTLKNVCVHSKLDTVGSR